MNTKATQEKIIKAYVHAYNHFDVEGMTKDLDENLRFVNMADGVMNMCLNNLAEFKTQAAQALALFSKRTQTITGWAFNDDVVEVAIDYHAVLATDLPNGLKEGDELNLQGKSVFKFSGDKVIEITDMG